MANTTGLTLTGKAVFVGEVVEIGDSFSKRALWVEIDRDSDYPQTVEVEFVKDKTALLNPIKIGNLVTVDVNLRGRVANTQKGERCFTTLNGWRIKVDGQGSAPAPKNELPASAASSALPGSGTEDDLPF